MVFVHPEKFSVITQNPQQVGLTLPRLTSLQIIDEIFRQLQREDRIGVIFPHICSTCSLYLSSSVVLQFYTFM